MYATLAKSRNYNDAPHIVASMGAWNHVWEVEVTTGDKPIQTGIKYNLLTTDAEYDAWLDGANGYRKYNDRISFDPLDNSNLREYTSNNYIAILAKTQGASILHSLMSVLVRMGMSSILTLQKIYLRRLVGLICMKILLCLEAPVMLVNIQRQEHQ